MLKIPFMVFVRNTEGYTKVKNEIDGMRNTDFMKNRQVTVELLPHSRFIGIIFR